MKILVAGATGMTGRLLVAQLLESGHQVRAIVRSPQKLPAEILCNTNLTIIEAAILDLSDDQLQTHTKSCDAVISCLGHTIDFKGIFGHPRYLCREVTRRLCLAIENNNAPKQVKFILMNSVGVANLQLQENRTYFNRSVLSLLRCILPPHRDNEMAAHFLQETLAQDNCHIEWCSVRPDTLINATVSPYEICMSPSTGIFSGRPTSRANVAHLMVALVESATIWNEWKFHMPVIMNTTS